MLHAEPQELAVEWQPHVILLSPEDNALKVGLEVLTRTANAATPHEPAGETSALRQIREIEEQVRQLEASLAALRAALEAPQPAAADTKPK